MAATLKHLLSQSQKRKKMGTAHRRPIALTTGQSRATSGDSAPTPGKPTTLTQTQMTMGAWAGGRVGQAEA